MDINTISDSGKQFLLLVVVVKSILLFEFRNTLKIMENIVLPTDWPKRRKTKSTLTHFGFNFTDIFLSFEIHCFNAEIEFNVIRKCVCSIPKMGKNEISFYGSNYYPLYGMVLRHYDDIKRFQVTLNSQWD